MADNYTSSFTMGSDKQYTISTKKRLKPKRIEKLLDKVPLIRGLWALISSNRIVFFIFLATFLYDAFLWLGPKAGTIPLIASIIYLIISVAFLIYTISTMFRSIKETWAFHGAEHKTIFAYEKGLELNLENVRSCPRVARRCGTNLVVFGLFFFVIFYFVIPFASVRAILAFAVAYEFFDLENGDKLPVTKIFFKIGAWCQKTLVTREPSDIQLLASIETMEKLVELEERLRQKKLEEACKTS